MLEHIYGHSEMIRNDEQFSIVIIILVQLFQFLLNHFIGISDEHLI